MLYPSINEIRKKADSRYTLVILAAQRARDLIDGKPSLLDEDIDRPVSVAAREIAEDFLTYKRPEPGAKSSDEAAAEVDAEAADSAEDVQAAGEADAGDDATAAVADADAEAGGEAAEAAEGDASEEAPEESGDAPAPAEDGASENDEDLYEIDTEEG